MSDGEALFMLTSWAKAIRRSPLLDASGFGNYLANGLMGNLLAQDCPLTCGS